MTRVVVVTGLSGAGRSVAAGALEDLGWFVIDNLPADLVPKVGELASSTTGTFDRVALVMGGFSEPVHQIEALRSQLGQLDQVTAVFLDTSTEALVRRYEATRRRHPLADGQGLVEAIEDERVRLAEARATADLVIDTTELNPHQLRDRLTREFGEVGHDETTRVTLTSFGFKYGLPLDVDIVLDCRFLPNPHWEDELRPMSGLDPEVQDYVLEREITASFLDRLNGMLDELVPAYEEQGKTFLTIAFGCTGGRHRSVAVAEALGRRLKEQGWRLRVSHRDVNRA